MKNLGVLSNEDLLTLYNNIVNYVKILEEEKKTVSEIEDKDDK